MEVLLAITVVAVLLTTFLTVFGPTANTIRRTLSAQEADRLFSALEKEMESLRADEIGQFDTPFDKAFDWINNSSSLDSAVILFNYRGDTTQIINGELAPYTDTTGSPGQDYLIQPAVRRIGDNSNGLENLMEAIEGDAFVVQMRQLVRDGNTGGLTATPTGGSIVSAAGESASSSEDFEDAAIALQAEFYLLPANTFQYVSVGLSSGSSDFSTVLGEPLFSRPMAVRR